MHTPDVPKPVDVYYIILIMIMLFTVNVLEIKIQRKTLIR